MNMAVFFTKECGILEIQADPIIMGDCVKIKVCVVDGEIHAGDDVEWLSYYPKAYQKAKIKSIHSDDGSINRAAEGMTVDILLSGNRQAKYLHGGVDSPFLRCLSNPLKGLLERKKTVTMGSYGGEAIEWLVLSAEGDERTMIAVKGQDDIPFNESMDDGNDWKTSYIRTWLNETFYNAAFSEEEKAMIVPGVTNDNVWLLSVEEAETYFADDAARVCYPTGYAASNHAYMSSSEADWWWLRSPGPYLDVAACVFSDGEIDSSYVDGSIMVRPVVVVRLGF